MEKFFYMQIVNYAKDDNELARHMNSDAQALEKCINRNNLTLNKE